MWEELGNQVVPLPLNWPRTRTGKVTVCRLHVEYRGSAALANGGIKEGLTVYGGGVVFELDDRETRTRCICWNV